jgi:hypothetical protein
MIVCVLSRPNAKDSRYETGHTLVDVANSSGNR